MNYDPFQRGAYPVGVRSAGLDDAARGRHVPVEIWYPAADSCVGRDLAEASRDRYEVVPGMPGEWQLAVRDAPARPASDRPDPAPLVLFSHGFGGHRRQSTFFCTHLASHGYVVVAMDHAGNTVADELERRGAGARDDRDRQLAVVRARPEDVIFVLDRLLAGDGALAGVAGPLARSRVGAAGHSFGGFTALAAAGRDPRFAAVVALAPAGGESPAAGRGLERFIDVERAGAAPTLVIAGAEDSVLPISGIRGLYQRLSGEKRLAVIHGADHFHFCDSAQRIHEVFRMLPLPVPAARALPRFSDLCPASHAYDVVRGLGLAHLDATLREHAAARDLMAGNLAALLAARGIAVETC